MGRGREKSSVFSNLEENKCQYKQAHYTQMNVNDRNIINHKKNIRKAEYFYDMLYIEK